MYERWSIRSGVYLDTLAAGQMSISPAAKARLSKAVAAQLPLFVLDVPNKDASGNLDTSMKGTLSVVLKNNKGQQVVLIKDAGVVAVSYTHLTLPTKRIV